MKKIIIGLVGILLLSIAIISIVVFIQKNNYCIIEIERDISTYADYSVEYYIKDKNIVKFDHKKLEGTHKELYYFKGINEGTTKITLEKKDEHGKILELAEYEVTVDNKLSAVITKKQTGKKVVDALLIIKYEESDENINDEKINTYEKIINSENILKVIEDKYGKVGNIKLELPEDSQLIRVIYVCDNHTDEECKMLLKDWIDEFSSKMKEIYNIKSTYILDEPEITFRIVK